MFLPIGGAQRATGLNVAPRRHLPIGKNTSESNGFWMRGTKRRMFEAAARQGGGRQGQDWKTAIVRTRLAALDGVFAPGKAGMPALRQSGIAGLWGKNISPR